MYHFKLIKPHYVFKETRFSTSDVAFAQSIASLLDAELYYWGGDDWYIVDSDFLQQDDDNGPFGKNTTGIYY